MDDNKTVDKLNDNLNKLIKGLEKQNSFLRNFCISVIQGVGGVIGATIIAGVILLILSKVIHSIEQIPLLDTLIKSAQIDKSINLKISPSPSP